LYVWRAVDSEGEVLDILVQPRRDRKAALKLMRKLLKKQGVTPATVVTDKLGSYSSALRELGVARRHDTGRWKNNRSENSHQRDVMTPGIHCCREDDDLAKAVRHMEELKVRRLPVINKSKRMVGILGLGDVSRSEPSDLLSEIVKSVSAHHN
jgi:CBS domain-containing protein